MKRALVLSGGGARGAYQIGVWKALRELNINYDIITGTSVGSLNGAMITQNSYQMAEDFWNNIDFKFVFGAAFLQEKDLKKNEIIKKYVNATFFNKGLDVIELENNIDKYLDIEKFFSSSIDYGLVTYNLATRKPMMLTKKDIPKENLKDFIIASATFYPFFKKKKINDKFYVDGGYYDNLPINFAIEMGATEIIAVYIGVFGRLKKVKNKRIPITYIRPKSRLGSPLMFNGALSKRGLQLGFNDTMKIYKELEGNYYTFKKGSINKIDDVFSKIPNCLIPNKLNKKNLNNDKFLEAIELLGWLFNIDESKIYDIEEFNNILIDKFVKFDKQVKDKQIKIQNARIFRNRKYVIRDIYNNITNKKIGKISRISSFFPRAILGSIYLSIIFKEKNN